MFDHGATLPSIFNDFSDSFMNSNPFISSSLPTFSFDSGSQFDRIFPLSAAEPFGDFSFGRLPKDDFSAGAGVVHNIPIKIEGECDSNAATTSAAAVGHFKRDHYAPEQIKPANTAQKSAAAGRNNGMCVPPPAPPLRKYFTSFQAASPSLSSFSTPNSEEDKTSRGPSGAALSRLGGKSLARPVIAPKPKNLCTAKESNKEQRDFSDYDRPNGEEDNVMKVAWRLAKLAAPLESRSDSPPWSRQNPKSSDSRQREQSSTSNFFKGLEVPSNTDDVGSSSPSSSGIVADASDSNTEYHQSSGFASERDSAYDYPRARPDVLMKSGKPVGERQFEKNPIMSPAVLSAADHYGTLSDSPNVFHPHLTQKKEQNSTSVLQNVFDGLDRNHHSLNADSDSLFSPTSYGSVYNYASNQPTKQPSGGLYPGSATNSWQLQTPTDAKLANSPIRNELAFSEDIGVSRKRTVCAKLSDNFRLLDMCIKTIEECTAPQAWRQPHVLQQHLLRIKEAVEAIVSSLGHFLDASSRIAIDPSLSKIDDLKRLISPLRNSYALLSQLKQSIDHIGWTLAALARPRSKSGTNAGNDALDQFVAVVKQVPVDCHKMLQWAVTLTPSPTIRFLASSPNDSFSVPFDGFGAFQAHNDFFKRPLDFDSSSDDSKRCSLTSTITASSSSDLQTPSTIRSRSSISNSANTQNEFTPQDLSSAQNAVAKVATSLQPESGPHTSNANGESRVIEEDDLESVLSDRESLCLENPLSGEEWRHGMHRRPLTNAPPSIQLSPELTSTLSEDDRQLLRFYAPQLESHIEFLSRAIEEFLSIVEEQLPPREFVQKGKLIILAAHKLIYIGDNISQCVSAPFLTAEAKKAADRLCCVLKNCVQTTKNAADKYPQVSAVQSMVDSIVTVSHAAHDLKLLVKQCC